MHKLVHYRTIQISNKFNYYIKNHRLLVNNNSTRLCVTQQQQCRLKTSNTRNNKHNKQQLNTGQIKVSQPVNHSSNTNNCYNQQKQQQKQQQQHDVTLYDIKISYSVLITIVIINTTVYILFNYIIDKDVYSTLLNSFILSYTNISQQRYYTAYTCQFTHIDLLHYIQNNLLLICISALLIPHIRYKQYIKLLLISYTLPATSVLFSYIMSNNIKQIDEIHNSFDYSVFDNELHSELYKQNKQFNRAIGCSVVVSSLICMNALLRRTYISYALLSIDMFNNIIGSFYPGLLQSIGLNTLSQSSYLHHIKGTVTGYIIYNALIKHNIYKQYETIKVEKLTRGIVLLCVVILCIAQEYYTYKQQHTKQKIKLMI